MCQICNKLETKEINHYEAGLMLVELRSEIGQGHFTEVKINLLANPVRSMSADFVKKIDQVLIANNTTRSTKDVELFLPNNEILLYNTAKQSSYGVLTSKNVGAFSNKEFDDAFDENMRKRELNLVHGLELDKYNTIYLDQDG